MIACLVTSNSKIKIQSSDSKNIKEITKVDLDEILARINSIPICIYNNSTIILDF